MTWALVLARPECGERQQPARRCQARTNRWTQVAFRPGQHRSPYRHAWSWSPAGRPTPRRAGSPWSSFSAHRSLSDAVPIRHPRADVDAGAGERYRTRSPDGFPTSTGAATLAVCAQQASARFFGVPLHHTPRFRRDPRRLLVRGTEVGEISGINGGDGLNNQDVRRAELVVDHRAIADKGADAQVAFDQRR